MGFLQRWKNLNRPRNRANGGLWDNINTPGSVGSSVTDTESNGVLDAPGNTSQLGPRIEPYLLRAATISDPYRSHGPVQNLLPRIPVQEPNGTPDLSTGVRTINAQQQGTAQPLAATSSVLARPQIRMRDVIYDAASPSTLRIPDSELQQYFNEKEEIQLVPTNTQFAHGVYANIYPVQRGWSQVYVPDPGMRTDAVGIAPPTLLSTPLHVATAQSAVQVNSVRSALTIGKAPKRQKSGG
jgi:hypothetical protein